MQTIRYFLKNRGVTIFLAILLGLGGIYSYKILGKLEDPEFKIKEAIVVTLYPGADAKEVEEKVTDKIELASKKVKDVEYIESVSKNGYSQVKIKLNESLDSNLVDQHWDELRKKIEDDKLELPIGALPPKVFDDYGDVYGIFLAVTGDGYTYKELSDYTNSVKKELENIDGVSKIEIFGKQDEVVYLKLKTEKLKELEMNPKEIAAKILGESILSGAGSINSEGNRIYVGFNNKIDNIEKLENLVIKTGGKLGENRIVKLKDIVEIERGYNKNFRKKMFYNGKKAIGISIAPKKGTNIISLGKSIEKKLTEIKEKTPIGLEIGKVYYQPELVSSAINNFVLNLVVSVITVVGVLLLAMGMRSGLIIGSGLVLAILGTFIFMVPMKIDIQRVSLGSFIIAMGILVDNSIVIVDGILVGMDKNENDNIFQVVRKNAIPLMGATFIAIIAFLPGALMPTYAGEYISSSFWVIGMSLFLSWVLCITIVPVLSEKYLVLGKVKKHDFEDKILKKSEEILEKLMENRKKVLFITTLLLVISLIGFLKIPKTFFPDSDKKGFVVNLWTREGKDIEVVEKEAHKLRDFILKEKEVKSVTEAIGAAPPRYYVSTIPEVGNTSYAELIVDVKKLKDVEKMSKKIDKYALENMPGVFVGVKKYPNGVPSEYPIEIEIAGNDSKILRSIGNKMIEILKKTPNTLNVKTNWRTPVLKIEGDISEKSIRDMKLNSLDLAEGPLILGDGLPLGFFEEGDNKIKILLKDSTGNLSNLMQMPIWGVGEQGNSLGSFLKNKKIIFEENAIWRKNRKRVLKVQCDIPVYLTADEVRKNIVKEVEKIELPKGYEFSWGGEYKEQKRNVEGILKFVPITLISMFTICVFIFGEVRTALLIFLTLPLSLIGIVPGLLILNRSFGFMSTIGVIALSGMMIKNVIVLVDEIRRNSVERIEKDVVVKAAVSRIRAVSLSAITTIFGMLTLIKDPLYGDMAITIILGLFVSTILTLFIFPLIYLELKKS